MKEMKYPDFKELFIQENGEKDMFDEPFSEEVIRFYAKVKGYKLIS